MMILALLETVDYNIFSVDWSKPAGSWYFGARYAVTDVGEMLSRYIQEILPDSLDNIILVGHSLGAHVAGICSKILNGKIAVIIGE